MKAAVAVVRRGRANTDKARLEESAGARPHEVQKVGRPRPTVHQPRPPPPGALPADVRGDWLAREGRGQATPPLGYSLSFRGRDATWGWGARLWGREPEATAREGGAGIGSASGVAAGCRRGGAYHGSAPKPPSAAARCWRPVPLYITARGGMGSGRRLLPAARPPRLSRATGSTGATAAASRGRPGAASLRCCQALAAEMRRWPFSEPGFPA